MNANARESISGCGSRLTCKLSNSDIGMSFERCTTWPVAPVVDVTAPYIILDIPSAVQHEDRRFQRAHVQRPYCLVWQRSRGRRRRAAVTCRIFGVNSTFRFIHVHLLPQRFPSRLGCSGRNEDLPVVVWDQSRRVGAAVELECVSPHPKCFAAAISSTRSLGGRATAVRIIG